MYICLYKLLTSFKWQSTVEGDTHSLLATSFSDVNLVNFRVIKRLTLFEMVLRG